MATASYRMEAHRAGTLEIFGPKALIVLGLALILMAGLVVFGVGPGPLTVEMETSGSQFTTLILDAPPPYCPDGGEGDPPRDPPLEPDPPSGRERPCGQPH